MKYTKKRNKVGRLVCVIFNAKFFCLILLFCIQCQAKMCKPVPSEVRLIVGLELLWKLI